VAFEPVSAIGTGNPDSPADASAVAEFFKDKYDNNLEVLYGGSVDGQNAKAFLQQKNISGLLVGTASLDPDEFIKIVEISYQFT